VLSIGKLVSGSEDYYLSMVAKGREEYYTGSGEAPGSWLGGGADDLGLAGEVTPETLKAILAGISPRNGAELGLPRRSGSRVAGFDLTFSAPKSISHLYALGSPEHSAAARAAHDRAVKEGEQPRYDEIAESITRYRARYEVDGDVSLGPRPADTFGRLAYDAVAAEIKDFERRRWRELEAPDLDLGLGR
jgi:hypothetical protein